MSQRRRQFSYSLLAACILSATACHAQYKGNHLPGFTGLENGTQAPPGLYLANMGYLYPTDNVRDANGNTINNSGSLTSSAEIVLLNFTTNFKILHANYGTAVGIPFIKNRIESNALNVSSSLALTDMIYSPLVLGWNLKRADVTAGYNIYLPVGKFSPGASDNTGLGMYGHEIYLGTTLFLDPKKSWGFAATYNAEFHSKKTGEDITVGDLGTIEGGLSKTYYHKVAGPIPMITHVGVAAYAQFKMTNDSGAAIPLLLRGHKDRVFGLGPEINTYIPKPRLTLLFRYEPEFGARERTQGQTFLFSIAWVAKSLVKHP